MSERNWDIRLLPYCYTLYCQGRAAAVSGTPLTPGMLNIDMKAPESLALALGTMHGKNQKKVLLVSELKDLIDQCFDVSMG